jgi:hypothetical protein
LKNLEEIKELARNLWEIRRDWRLSTRAYWVFELRPLSSTLKNAKQHNLSEIGSVLSSGAGLGGNCSVGSFRKS